MNKSAQLKQLLKQHLDCKRDETVDFVWTQLASNNVKLDIDNKDAVLSKGKRVYEELLKDW